MICYFKAISIILDSVNFYLYDKKISVKIEKSLNMISSCNIYSNTNIPKFNNSAMDGFAFKHSGLIDFIKKKYSIIGTLKAGENVNIFYKNKNSVVEIMTGANIPREFDTVIKIEDTDYKKNNNVTFRKLVKKGANVRISGEDYKTDDILVKKGEVINTSHVMSLSAFGISSINVIKKTKIYIICTGKEISDDNNSIDDNSINNVNGPYLKCILKNLGFSVSYLGIIKDCEEKFLNLIKSIINNDELILIISTGAVSRGKADFIPEALSKLKVNILFHRVNIKPGKPLLYAKMNSNIYFFSLPGNIISTVIGFRFFLYPFLRHINGMSFENPIKARLLNISYFSKKDVFLKAFFYFKNACLYVNILEEQESFKISGLLESNCFVFLYSSIIYKKNDLVNIYSYEVLF